MRGQNSEDHPDRRPAPKGDPIRETRLRLPQSPPSRRSVLLRPRLAAGSNAKRRESKRQRRLQRRSARAAVYRQSTPPGARAQAPHHQPGVSGISTDDPASAGKRWELRDRRPASKTGCGEQRAQILQQFMGLHREDPTPRGAGVGGRPVQPDGTAGGV